MTGEEVRVLRMLARGRYTQLSKRDPLVSRQLLHAQCSPVYRMRGCLIVLGTNHHSFSGSVISVTLVSKRPMDLQWQYAERVEESVTGWSFCICSNRSDFQPNGNVSSSCELKLYRGKLIPLTSRYWSAIPPSCVSLRKEWYFTSKMPSTLASTPVDTFHRERPSSKRSRLNMYAQHLEQKYLLKLFVKLYTIRCCRSAMV